MKNIAEQLPPEIARQIHPDRRKNEEGYWAVRDQLLGQYRDQWIGFANGKVIASGSSPVAVLHAAEATGLHPFFICVGREEEPCRIRRASFPYNASYPGEALPVIAVEFQPGRSLRSFPKNNVGDWRRQKHPVLRQHFLKLFPEPHGQRSFLPSFSVSSLAP